MGSGSTTTPRLVRPEQGRVLGGVCQGIAEHFGIDPVIVRVGFVVAAFFGGAGVIAYVAGWLLVPDEGDAVSVGERALREHRWARIAGFVLIAIALSSLVRPVWWFGGHVVFAVLLIVGGLYLLSPTFTERDHREHEPPASMGSTASTTTPPPTPPREPIPFAPPSTPQPAPPPRPSRRRRGGLGALTFGVLFLGAGVIGIALAAGRSVEPAYVFAGGLLVVGAALVASTWVGRSFTLIPLGLLLVGLLSVSTLIDVPLDGGVGEKHVTPTSVTDLQSVYHHGIGELQLDLTHVDFVRGRTYDVTATVGIGHLLVLLPRGVTAEIHAHAGAGEVRLLDDADGGVRVDRDTTLTAAGENPPTVVLHLEVGLGQAEVQDAAS